MTTNTAPKNTTPHDDLARSIPTFDMTAYDTDFDSFAKKSVTASKNLAFAA